MNPHQASRGAEGVVVRQRKRVQPLADFPMRQQLLDLHRLHAALVGRIFTPGERFSGAWVASNLLGRQVKWKEPDLRPALYLFEFKKVVRVLAPPASHHATTGDMRHRGDRDRAERRLAAIGQLLLAHASLRNFAPRRISDGIGRGRHLDDDGRLRGDILIGKQLPRLVIDQKNVDFVHR